MRPVFTALAAAIMLACSTPAAQTVPMEHASYRVVLCNFEPATVQETNRIIAALLTGSFHISIEASANCEQVENRREVHLWVISISRQRFRLGPHDSIWPTPAAEEMWDRLIGVRMPYDVRIANTEVYSALPDYFAAEPVMLFGRNSRQGISGPVLCPIVVELPRPVQQHLTTRCVLRAFGYARAFSDYSPTQGFDLDAYESITTTE